MLHKRNLLKKIEKVLGREEYIIVTGARQAGKTSLLLLIKENLEIKGDTCHYLNLENPEYLGALNKHPFGLFDLIPASKEKTIVLLDEVQYLADPTHTLKLLYDEKRTQVRIIASGSSSFYIDRNFTDSLAGRKFLFELPTLSFDEFLEFRGITDTSQYRQAWDEYVRFGGYPNVALAESAKTKQILLEEIAAAYVKKDIGDAGIRQSDVFLRLLKLIADQTGSLVNTHELANTLDIAHKTVVEYLRVAQTSYHLTLITPFFKNIRKELTKMPKAYFNDLGLRNAILRNYAPAGKRVDSGMVAENTVFRELLLKKQSLEQIRFWRTQDKKEVDFVVGKRAYEVKYDTQRVKDSQYRQFQESYPEIVFSLLAYAEIMNEFYPDLAP